MKVGWLAAFTAALVLTVLAFVLTGKADARSGVPSRARARADMVRFFPASAPTSLLKSMAWRTRWLRVEPARRCSRTRLRVACSFRVRLVPKRGNTNAPVRCHGELWAREVHGLVVGRVGDYVCRSESAGVDGSPHELSRTTTNRRRGT
jgi:hypothetical protein